MPNAASVKLYGTELSRFKHINSTAVRAQKGLMARQLSMAYESPTRGLSNGVRSFGVNPDAFGITPAAFERLVRRPGIEIAMAYHLKHGSTVDVALNNILGRDGLITYFDPAINRFWVMRVRDTKPYVERQDGFWASDDIYHVSTMELDRALEAFKPVADRRRAKSEDKAISSVLKIQSIKDVFSAIFADSDVEIANQLLWIITLRMMDHPQRNDPKTLFGRFWEDHNPAKSKARAFVDEIAKVIANAPDRTIDNYEAMILFSDLPAELSALIK